MGRKEFLFKHFWELFSKEAPFQNEDETLAFETLRDQINKKAKEEVSLLFCLGKKDLKKNSKKGDKDEKIQELMGLGNNGEEIRGFFEKIRKNI